MKKNLLAFAVIAISLLGTSCEKNELMTSPGDIAAPVGRGGIGSDEGDACIQPVTARLMIEKDGKNNNYEDHVGYVVITNNADSITINYNCINGNVLKEVRVWAGQKQDAPVNNAGHPKFGQFMAEVNSISNLPNYTIKLPVSAIGLGNNGIIIAHAKVFKHNSESSWGEGPQFVSPKGKALYIPYTACNSN